MIALWFSVPLAAVFYVFWFGFMAGMPDTRSYVAVLGAGLFLALALIPGTFFQHSLIDPPFHLFLAVTLCGFFGGAAVWLTNRMMRSAGAMRWMISTFGFVLAPMVLFH